MLKIIKEKRAFLREEQPSLLIKLKLSEAHQNMGYYKKSSLNADVTRQKLKFLITILENSRECND